MDWWWTRAYVVGLSRHLEELVRIEPQEEEHGVAAGELKQRAQVRAQPFTDLVDERESGCELVHAQHIRKELLSKKHTTLNFNENFEYFLKSWHI